MDSKTFIRHCFDFPNLFVHILFQSTIVKNEIDLSMIKRILSAL